MKNYLGFALGIIVGCVGLLCTQLFINSNEEEDLISPTEGAEKQSLSARRQQQQLVGARDRIAELEAQVATLDSGNVSSVADDVDEDPKEGDKGNKAASFIEMMMSLGERGAQRSLDKEVARLTEVLGLSENQQAVVREALIKKAAEVKAAGFRLVTGGASIADLLLADEHDFTVADAAIETVLDADQLEGYQAEQAEREVRRIEKKTEEELTQLTKGAELSEEQQQAAWDILSEINAGEIPGSVPEGASGEEFMQIVDGAIENRIKGLTSILDDEQMKVYHGQTEDFRTMITTLVGHATK